MKFCKIFVLFCATAFPTLPVLGRPNGAPQSSCADLAPHHSGAAAQDSPAPYNVSVSATKIEQGGTVKVTISTDSDPFKGFLVVARTADVEGDTTPYGIFVATDDQAKNQTCLGRPESSATHTTSDLKQSITLEWIAPNRDGHYRFLATVVKQKVVFWVGIPSEIITVGSGKPPVEGIEDGTTISPPEAVDPELIYSGCGDTKGCFGIPGNCLEGKTCEMVVSYASDVPGRVKFELMGKTVQRTTPYVAVGLSRDDKMGEDSVFGCSVADAKVEVGEYFNTADKNNQPVIREASIISDSSGSASEGYVSCTFNVAGLYSVLSSDSSFKFDLFNDEYYFLLARGEASGGYLQKHPTRDDNAASGSTTKLTVKQVLKSKSDTLLRLHGAFMIIAWILCASVGIFTARYYKQDYAPIEPCGVAFWFAVHRSCMVLAAFFTIAGFIFIFVYVGGYTSSSGRSAETYHPILGIIVTSLVVLQIIAAQFRPSPSSERRPIFNWLHWTGGNSAHIIAIACIFLAHDLAKTSLSGNMAYWIALTVFVIYHLLLHVAMSFTTLQADKRLNAGNSNRALTFGPLPSSKRDDEIPLGHTQRTYNMVRSVLLFLYLAGAALTAAVLLYYVVNI